MPLVGGQTKREKARGGPDTIESDGSPGWFLYATACSFSINKNLRFFNVNINVNINIGEL